MEINKNQYNNENKQINIFKFSFCFLIKLIELNS